MPFVKHSPTTYWSKNYHYHFLQRSTLVPEGIKCIAPMCTAPTWGDIALSLIYLNHILAWTALCMSTPDLHLWSSSLIFEAPSLGITLTGGHWACEGLLAEYHSQPPSRPGHVHLRLALSSLLINTSVAAGVLDQWRQRLYLSVLQSLFQCPGLSVASRACCWQPWAVPGHSPPDPASPPSHVWLPVNTYMSSPPRSSVLGRSWA